MFKDLPFIEQPRPDVTYGLWKHDISSILRATLDFCHCELAKDLYLPFFLVEVKSQNAIPGEAENQCVRGEAPSVEPSRGQGNSSPEYEQEGEGRGAH